MRYEDPYPIDQAALQRFLSYCRRRQYRSKGVVVRPGDPASTLFYILEGSVSVIVEDEKGREIVLTYLNKGDFIGEIGLFFHHERRGALVRARTACELAEIRYSELQKLAETKLKDDYPHLLFAVGLQLSRRLLHTTRKVSRLAFMDAAGRIARTLLDLCEEPDALSHPDGTQIHVSRQELSRIVGCSREVVGRVLKDMEDQGLITAAGMTIVVFHAR